ncbi:MAG: glycosyltransferase [Pedobacter sp.]|nr:glycosyltransferase [Pedobacter sp.]
MINGQKIVCISNTSWFGNYAKSTVQILERLAKQNEVLFVEYPYTWSDLINTFRGRKQAPAHRMLGLKSRLQRLKTDSETEVYDLVIPPVIPVYFLQNEKVFEMLFKWNVFIYRHTLKKYLKKLKFDHPLVITAYNPLYGLPLQNTLGEKAHIYYCYDGVESGFFGKRIFTYEDDFSRSADAIITTSEFLLNQKLKFNTESFLVKNGVDFPLFSKYAKKDVLYRKRKKIGFIGSLDPRFDIDTVEYAVSVLQEYDFEFTGDMRNEKMRSRLSKYPNVRFFDPVKPTEVPPLLANYDAGMIPYIVNEVNKNIYPLKINEYLAVGVPLVMTPFAVLPEFEGLVGVSTDKEDFAVKLKAGIESDTAEKIRDRVLFAETNSWDARTEAFSNILEKYV